MVFFKTEDRLRNLEKLIVFREKEYSDSNEMGQRICFEQNQVC